MGVVAKLRRGEGRFYGSAKRVAQGFLQAHVPVPRPLRFFFRLLYRLHVAVREGLSWAARFFWYEPLFRSQCEAVGSGFRMEQLPYITGHGKLVLGDRVELSGKSSFGFSSRFRTDPELVIGDDTFIGHGCSFAVADSVRIGSHCLLAAGVSVRDNDGHPVEAARRRAKHSCPPEAVRPVVIGDDVWVGGGALILKGVTVGDRAVIAARSVVTKDVPSNVIVAGNPARAVKELPLECHG